MAATDAAVRSRRFTALMQRPGRGPGPGIPPRCGTTSVRRTCAVRGCAAEIAGRGTTDYRDVTDKDRTSLSVPSVQSVKSAVKKGFAPAESDGRVVNGLPDPQKLGGLA